ncbi:MAG: hypothetical protein MZU95_15235 [Desulfomicrobium escambiense]|nr:hypothetical protein [Desulfomicrobium escambiense]
MDTRSDVRVVAAQVPLAEMFGYATIVALAHPGTRDLHHAGISHYERGAGAASPRPLRSCHERRTAQWLRRNSRGRSRT